MAKKTIVLLGQTYLGDVPQIVKVAHAQLAFAGGDVNTGAVQATYAIFNVPAGCLVIDSLAITTVAWTTSVTLDFGDAANTNGWLPTATLAPTTAVATGLLKRTIANANSEVYRNGKRYAAATDLSVVVGGANPAVGTTDFYLLYIENYLASGF